MIWGLTDCAVTSVLVSGWILIIFQTKAGMARSHTVHVCTFRCFPAAVIYQSSGDHHERSSTCFGWILPPSRWPYCGIRSAVKSNCYHPSNQMGVINADEYDAVVHELYHDVSDFDLEEQPTVKLESNTVDFGEIRSAILFTNPVTASWSRL